MIESIQVYPDGSLVVLFREAGLFEPVRSYRLAGVDVPDGDVAAGRRAQAGWLDAPPPVEPPDPEAALVLAAAHVVEQDGRRVFMRQWAVSAATAGDPPARSRRK